MATQFIDVSADAGADEGRLDDVLDFASDGPSPHVSWLTAVDTPQPRMNLKSLSPHLRALKRASDVVVSLALLAILWPAMLLIAALIRLTSSGPAIFRQTRVGLNLRHGNDRRQQDHGPVDPERRTSQEDRRGQFTYGRHFTLYKFRTMRMDAEKDGARFTIPDDERITAVGRVLRKTRFDELPQLWNVLRGEMSMVGPRPERPEFVADLSLKIPNYLQRLGLRPGLTGVAQIENGYDNEIEGFQRKVAFDVLYLQNCSLGNDLKILLRTIGIVVTGKGAL